MCGNTAFRETEISIDGTPAGVAPVYPWIFTGGIDPYLWSPIPGVQTLDFIPYRVDLSPFAGLLSNGQPHTVALSVFNADSYFSATASLLLYLDSGSTQVTGAITHNTLSAAPTPVVLENINTVNGATVGAVKVTSERTYIIEGYVDTSHGRVNTEVSDLVNFSSVERFDISSLQYVQDITQDNDLSSASAVTDHGTTTYTSQSFGYPLNLDISVAYNSDGSGVQTTKVNQQYNTTSSVGNQRGEYDSTGSNVVTATDMLDFNSSGEITGNTGQKSSQNYSFTSSSPGGDQCYDRTIRAANGVLTGVQNGCSSQ